MTLLTVLEKFIYMTCDNNLRHNKMCHKNYFWTHELPSRLLKWSCLFLINLGVHGSSDYHIQKYCQLYLVPIKTTLCLVIYDIDRAFFIIVSLFTPFICSFNSIQMRHHCTQYPFTHCHLIHHCILHTRHEVSVCIPVHWSSYQFYLLTLVADILLRLLNYVK